MDKKIIEKLVRPCVLPLTPYNPGKVPEARVRVMANENNLGISEEALRIMTREILFANRYPDISCSALRKKLAEKHNISEDNIIVGNGLDGVFTMLGRAFINPDDEVICGDFTFSVYSDIACIMDGRAVKVPMTETLGMDIDGFISAITHKTKLICLCNPNNPTGSVLPVSEVTRLLHAAPKTALVIVDEAYIEFSHDIPTVLPLLSQYPNLVVCRTFSKLFGLAGLRVGWAAADSDIITQLYKVREPYCVSRIAAAAAYAVLSDEDYIDDTRAMVMAERVRFYDFFDAHGIKYYPTDANFILFTLDEKTEEIYKKLFDEGILLRLMSHNGKKYLRLSIGDIEENIVILEELEKLV